VELITAVSSPPGGCEVPGKGRQFPVTLGSLCALAGTREKRCAAGSHPALASSN